MKPVVLLVEDETINLALYATALEEVGYAVIKAQSLPEALDRVKQLGRLDLLVTEMVLMDHLQLLKGPAHRFSTRGVELVRKLGALHPTLRVVVLADTLPEPPPPVGTIAPEHIRFLTRPCSAEALARTATQLLAPNKGTTTR